jgi:DNA-directed RNA polymerase subunit F
MDRNFHRGPAAPTGASPPSEAWLFAQAVLGKPVPSASRQEADARARREHLEWLAQISPEDGRRVRGQLSEGADAKAQRKLLEWLADISPEHEVKLRSLQRAEAQARETREHWEWLAEVSTVHEGTWDPSQHPRASKGQPDGGQWVAKGGAGSTSGNPDHTGTGGKPRAIDQHSAPPAMLELANAWWKTHSQVGQALA